MRDDNLTWNFLYLKASFLSINRLYVIHTCADYSFFLSFIKQLTTSSVSFYKIPTRHKFICMWKITQLTENILVSHRFRCFFSFPNPRHDNETKKKVSFLFNSIFIIITQKSHKTLFSNDLIFSHSQIFSYSTFNDKRKAEHKSM